MVEALKGVGTGDPSVDADEGAVRIPVGGEGPVALLESVRRLDEADIRLADIALHRPTLDDVFLTLTGRRPPRTKRKPTAGRQEGASAAARRKERMSATVQQAPTRAARAHATWPARVALAFADGLLVARRNLVTLTRVPTVFVFELVQPIMFVLLFRFIYAKNIRRTCRRDFSYVQFLMPGIFVQNAIFGSTTTAIGLAEDLKKGIIDRFRSLPDGALGGAASAAPPPTS